MVNNSRGGPVPQSRAGIFTDLAQCVTQRDTQASDVLGAEVGDQSLAGSPDFLDCQHDSWLGVVVVVGDVFLAYPSKDATIFWTVSLNTSFSLLAFLAAYLGHLEYVGTGRARALLFSGAALLVSLGAYDQCIFLPALFLITPSTKTQTARRVFNGTATAWSLTAAFLVFKFFLVGRMYSIPYEKNIVLSPRHFIYVYLAGLNANLGPQLLLAGARAALHAWVWAPALAAAACLLPWLASRDAAARAEKIDCLRLAWLGAGVFLLGYLPIALSDYSPTPLNHGNRINLVPVLGLLMWMAAAGPFRSERGRGFLALRAVASAALAAHLGFSAFWIEGARRVDRVRVLIADQLPSWPRDTKLFVRLPERYVEEKVPIFDSPGDISAAVWIWTGDRGRAANVVSPRVTYSRDGLSADGAPPLPYERIRLLDVPQGRIIAVDEQTFRRLPPAL